MTLKILEVTVGSQSDDRGLVGMDDAIPAGPLNVEIRIRIGADSAAPEQLHRIIEWAEHHSPVGDAIRRSVPTKVEVEIA